MSSNEPIDSRHPLVAAASRIATPIQEFVHLEAAGGILLLLAAVAAVAWANAPFSESYGDLWGHVLGGFGLELSLRHWINDGLMTVFFFVVGLEIKREVTTGELSNPRAAALPAVAALGGMAMPALIYVAVNASNSDALSGWAVPVATDIAFATGVLSLLGSRVPASLKAFLLALAIVDDIGAILVIALFYAGGIDVLWLGVAAGTIGLVLALNLSGVRHVRVYVALGTVAWLATYESGIHATIAGVVLGLLTPEKPHAGKQETVAPLDRLEHALHPWSSFLIVPLFALANAGVSVSGPAIADAAHSSVTIGILLGLLVGKPVGIALFSLVAIKTRLSAAPGGVGIDDIFGAGLLAGIGFTVALFITELGFDDVATIEDAKLGIFAASIVSGVIGFLFLRVSLDPAGDDAAAS